MRSELTSDNCPIRVDFIPRDIVPFAGRIGMTIAPGKKIDGIYGNWNRDLEKDLLHLKSAHGTRVLVCLLEDHELTLLKIPDLVPMAEKLGIQLLCLPIPDVSVCEDPQRLRDLVAKIMGAVERGSTVVIHCRGGKGRSGMVAACCLGAIGIEPCHAMKVVRQSRRGTIETAAQEEAVTDFCNRISSGQAWAFDRFSIAEPPTKRPQFSRFLGSLVGGAVGDALGFPIEFVGSGEQILSRFGKDPPASLDFANGKVQVSDDTQMTLFIAEGVIRAVQRSRDRGLCNVPDVLMRALLRWFDTQTLGCPADFREPDYVRNGWLRTETRLYTRRAPGNTCMSSLAKLAANPEEPWTNDSKGCGAIMRIAPIGLAASDRESAFATACESGKITHGHPMGYLPAGYLASVLNDLTRGTGLLDAMALADDLLGQIAAGQDTGDLFGAPDQTEAAELLRWTRRARQASKELSSSGSHEVIESLGAGWTGEEALAVSLCCALTVNEGSSEDIARALWAAAAHGGDSDSTAAITGNILGAIYGIEALPKAWAKNVELRDIVERLASDLYSVSFFDESLDFDVYPPN